MSHVMLPAVAVALSAVDLLLLLNGLYMWALVGTGLVVAVCVIILSRLLGVSRLLSDRARLRALGVIGRAETP